MSDHAAVLYAACPDKDEDGYCEYCTALNALVAERDEARRLVNGYRQADKTIARAEAAEAEVARLQHIIDCADTPLMRDVLAERDRLREAMGQILNGEDPIRIARAALKENTP